MKRARTALRFEQIARARRLPVEADTVLYESFAGSGVLDNPEAIFREILASPDLAHLRHVWALDKSSAHDAVRREFQSDRRVRFVERESADYWKALSTSGTLVNNATFPVQFGKRPGQVYLNTWHGTPLKAMGYDMPDGARESANTIRNFVQADYLLAQNAFMAEQMYGRAYKLDGVFRGTVIREGYRGSTASGSRPTTSCERAMLSTPAAWASAAAASCCTRRPGAATPSAIRPTTSKPSCERSPICSSASATSTSCC